uniref:Uncharacterized protein n=1 Tax=Zea mays TaxID=4577 RepID=A0A804NQR8_MAIZE
MAAAAEAAGQLPSAHEADERVRALPTGGWAAVGVLRAGPQTLPGGPRAGKCLAAQKPVAGAGPLTQKRIKAGARDASTLGRRGQRKFADYRNAKPCFNRTHGNRGPASKGSCQGLAAALGMRKAVALPAPRTRRSQAQGHGRTTANRLRCAGTRSRRERAHEGRDGGAAPAGGLAYPRRGLGAVPRRRTQGSRRWDEGTAAMAPRHACREWSGTTNRLPPTRKKAKSKVRERRRRRELTLADEQWRRGSDERRPTSSTREVRV